MAISITSVSASAGSQRQQRRHGAIISIEGKLAKKASGIEKLAK
jgi:hypothetical protein